MERARIGLADNWLRHIQEVHDRHQALLDGIATEHRLDALCELNVIEQVRNVSQTTVMQDAWMRDQDITVHGWVYGLNDGLLQDLNMTVYDTESIGAVYKLAVVNVAARQRS